MLMLLSVHVTRVLFLVLVGNSALTMEVTRSYSSHLFLCALGHCIMDVVKLLKR